MFASFSVLIEGGLVFVAFSEDVVLPASLEVDVDDSTDVEPPEDPIDPELPEFPVEAEPDVAVVPPAGASALAVALDEVPPLLAEAPAELPLEVAPADAPPPAEPTPDEEPPSAEPARAAAGAGREKQRSVASKPSRPANRFDLPVTLQHPCVISPAFRRGTYALFAGIATSESFRAEEGNCSSAETESRTTPRRAWLRARILL